MWLTESGFGVHLVCTRTGRSLTAFDRLRGCLSFEDKTSCGSLWYDDIVHLNGLKPNYTPEN